MNWIECEKLCFEYLQSYENESIQFLREGGSNSMAPDIKVFKNSRFKYNIEVKKPISQACQFVVEEGIDKFFFSNRNKDKSEEDLCQPIIDFINQNFKKYDNVTQKGMLISCENQLLINRFISYYQNFKKSNFLICYEKGNFVISKVNDVAEFYTLKCFLRRKKSGSRSLPNKDKDETIQLISNALSNLNLVYSFDAADGKIFLSFTDEVLFNLNKLNIQQNGHKIYFSKVACNIFEVRVLSNTNNPNVLLTLNLKKDHPNSQLEDLLNDLK